MWANVRSADGADGLYPVGMQDFTVCGNNPPAGGGWWKRADVVEMADTADSKSDGASRAGSKPAIGTCPLYGLNLKFTGSETSLQSW